MAIFMTFYSFKNNYIPSLGNISIFSNLNEPHFRKKTIITTCRNRMSCHVQTSCFKRFSHSQCTFAINFTIYICLCGMTC